MLSTQASLLQTAAEQQERQDEAFRLLESRGTPVKYRKDQYVLLDYPSIEGRTSHHGPPNKFLPYLKGPFRVVGKLGSSYYEIRCLISDKVDKVHVSRLRPFLIDRTGSTDDSLREVAMMDYIYDYPIDRVLQHQGSPTARKELQFLIRWKNYGQDRDSWLPYKALRDSTELHNYILSLPDRTFLTLIPERFHSQYDIKREVRAARAPVPPTTSPRQEKDAATLVAITRKRKSPTSRTTEEM